MEQLFIELAKNKDITDEELTEELCYLYAKEKHEQVYRTGQSADLRAIIGTVAHIRKRNPALDPVLGDPKPHLRDDELLKFMLVRGLRLGDHIPDFHINERYVMIIEKYEMNKRIRSLEQTLAAFMEQTKVERLSQEAVIQSLEQTLKTFMEQTKVERLSQEAVMQSLSNELDEFQEEFYDCQSEVKEQKERIELIEETLTETIQIVMERVPFVKDKTD